MSLVSTALSVAQFALLQVAAGRQRRLIGDLVPMVVIREAHTDRVQLSEHPLEKGANIADHAIKLPVQLQLEYRWSSTPQGAGLTLTGGLLQYSIQQVYEKLREYQDNFVLLDVTTGKRKYSNMILLALEVMTDRLTENELAVSATLQEVLLVSAVTTNLSTDGAAKVPAVTSPVQDRGFCQLSPGRSVPAIFP
jgi:hypothetical protein